VVSLVHMTKTFLPLLLVGGVLFFPAFGQETNAAPGPTSVPANAKWTSITAEERKALLKARADALKANPDFVAEGKDLAERSKELQKKIDAAAIKINPDVEAILQKAHPVQLPKDTSAAGKTSPSEKPVLNSTKPDSSPAGTSENTSPALH